MQTINAPVIKERSGLFNGRLMRAGQLKSNKKGIANVLVYLLIMILFCAVAPQKAYAEHKISGNMKLREFEEKAFSLHFDKDRRQLQVNGIMEIGILPEFEKMLSKHPELTEVVFNSYGGNIYQARGLANVIISKQLNTYVSENCYSACTIAYVAGKVRNMGPNGRLGFHQYAMKSKMLNQLFNVEKEQAKDLTYFKSRIPDNRFIEKIFGSKNSDLWVPEHKDLLKTGVIHKIIADSDNLL